ncbi:MAG: HPr kinase/phosphorylase, partial [Spirochaetales bacterium]
MGNFTVLNLLDLEPEPPNTLQLRCMCGRKGLVREVISADINRPGLALAGFFNQFAGERIQVIGQGEYAYIQNLSPDKLSESLKRIQEYPIPC